MAALSQSSPILSPETPKDPTFLGVLRPQFPLGLCQTTPLCPTHGHAHVPSPSRVPGLPPQRQSYPALAPTFCLREMDLKTLAAKAQGHQGACETWTSEVPFIFSPPLLRLSRAGLKSIGQFG